MHYLDDFLFVGSPGTDECQQALAITLATCEELGVPIAPDKTEGPTTSLTFLGIELNTASMSTSLPASKLAKLRTMVREFLGARVVRDKHALESLVGHLIHATKVFPLGKAYLNALFAVKASMVPGQIRRINLEARSELGVGASVPAAEAPQPPPAHGCVRCLGLQRMVPATLVSDAVVPRDHPSQYCS